MLRRVTDLVGLKGCVADFLCRLDAGVSWQSWFLLVWVLEFSLFVCTWQGFLLSFR